MNIYWTPWIVAGLNDNILMYFTRVCAQPLLPASWRPVRTQTLQTELVEMESPVHKGWTTKSWWHSPMQMPLQTVYEQLNRDTTLPHAGKQRSLLVRQLAADLHCREMWDWRTSSRLLSFSAVTLISTQRQHFKCQTLMLFDGDWPDLRSQSVSCASSLSFTQTDAPSTNEHSVVQGVMSLSAWPSP